jgi:hypothetical protein
MLSQVMSGHAYGKDESDDDQGDENAALVWVHSLLPGAS